MAATSGQRLLTERPMVRMTDEQLEKLTGKKFTGHQGPRDPLEITLTEEQWKAEEQHKNPLDLTKPEHKREEEDEGERNVKKNKTEKEQ